MNLVIINLIFIGIGILAFVLPAASLKKRFSAARQRLQEAAVDKELLDKFDSTLRAATRYVQKRYWLWAAVFLVGGTIVTQIITSTIESRAGVLAWLIFYVVTMGVGALAFLVMMSFAFVRMLQLRDISRLLKEAQAQHPDKAVFEEVIVLLGAARGEIGTSAISLIAMISALLSGFGLIALFFGVAQTAIECARSSKCM